MMLTHMRRAGHQVLPLVGGATGMIGDPLGQVQRAPAARPRPVDREHRADPAQIERFFANDEGPPAKIVDNLDWLGGVRLLEFLRDIGKHFAVNQMIQRDSVKQRFESREAGSRTPSSRTCCCRRTTSSSCTAATAAACRSAPPTSGATSCRASIWCGGSEGAAVYGLTSPLLTDSDGKKYGKSEKGAVYLDPKLTSPYAFYQFWLNTADADVGRFLRWLTVRPRGGDRGLRVVAGRRAAGAEGARRGSHPARARRGELATVLRATEALFGGGDLREIGGDILDEALAAAPAITVPRSRFEGEGALVVDLLAEVGACPRSPTPAGSSARAASRSTASRSAPPRSTRA